MFCRETSDCVAETLQEMSSGISVKKVEHHEQLELCQTRAKYRQGRKLTAVKVYTVNDESKYLIVNGVPAIKIGSELESLCLRYGDVQVLDILPDYPCEEYTEVYLLKYRNIKSARFAKIQLDGKSYYGGVLHVCYAPELETLEETREKLADRRKTVAALTRYKQDPSLVNPSKRRNSQVLSGAAGRYLVHLKPELRNINQDFVNNSPIMGGPSDEGRTTSQASVGANFNTSCPSESCASLQQPPITLIPRTVKRQMNFPSPTVPNTKKIKVFGNKNILAYKSNGK